MSAPPGFPRRLIAGVLILLAPSSLLPAQESGSKAGHSAMPAPAIATGELILHKWSGLLNVPDPVACTVDPEGRVYVAATTRRKAADLDIREHTAWIPDDVGLTSIEDKRAFFHRELAPGKNRGPRGSLQDHNGDGSVDWQDLTRHTERIYQVRDTDGDGTADRITVFAEGFNTEVTGIAAGILYHDGWVYATIAPDLWRLKDTDDDGVADVREVVAHGFGVHIAYAGHDMHGLVAGPDGRIYWSIGDKGVNVTSREGVRFEYPNEGCVLRIDPDGSNFEVYAHGLRNVQEPAFNDFGDLIGVDNDADNPGERERFVYIVEGSDSGWRCNFQYMQAESPWMREGLWQPSFPGQAAYLLPPLASYSDGPAGFKYDPGTALGDEQRGLFLLNEFPSGKMRGFHATPDGATFRMTGARIVNDGIMGIGMSWHPDGSLMMVDWIGGYPLDGKGALWRVDARDGPANPLRQETHRILTRGFASSDERTLLAHLGHRDQRVRQGAQLELAKRESQAGLLAVAGDGTASRLARIHALWGHGQLLRRNAAGAAALRPLLQDPDAEIRAQTAKVLGDAARAGAKDEGRLLVPLLRDPAPRVRLQAAIALGKFREPEAVPALLELAEQDGHVPALRHAVATGLTGCATPAQLAASRTAPSLSVRLACVVALRRRASPALAGFLQDPDLRVIEEAARAIHDDRSVPAALPALAALLEAPARSPVVTRRAINASLRLGDPRSAERLLTLALDRAALRPMREEALVALRLWNAPPRLDRVDGYARSIQTEPIAHVLTPRLGALLALDDPGLKTIAIEIMIAHGLEARSDQIAAIVASPETAGELRAQALRLMAAGEHRTRPEFAAALTTGLAADAPAVLYCTALALLLPGQPERLVREARTVLQDRTEPEQQHAIALLAKAASTSADDLLLALADTLAAGRCAPGLQLDVLEALRARGPANPELAARLRAYSASAAAAARGELLAGGDILRGRDLVANHLNANCTACHSVGKSGGSEVGPNLRTIGSRHDPAYLLESLLAPSASIAPGYGIVNVTLHDQSVVTGTLATATPAAVTVRLFDGRRQVIPRARIASQSTPVSFMPAMEGILQPRELRDVVTYLRSLQDDSRPPRRDRE